MKKNFRDFAFGYAKNPVFQTRLKGGHFYAVV